MLNHRLWFRLAALFIYRYLRFDPSAAKQGLDMQGWGMRSKWSILFSKVKACGASFLGSSFLISILTLVLI